MCAKPCGRCGHLKGRHGHRINQTVHLFHPDRVTYFCVTGCECKRHTDDDRYYQTGKPA